MIHKIIYTVTEENILNTVRVYNNAVLKKNSKLSSSLGSSIVFVPSALLSIFLHLQNISLIVFKKYSFITHHTKINLTHMFHIHIGGTGKRVKCRYNISMFLLCMSTIRVKHLNALTLVVFRCLTRKEKLNANNSI